MKRSILSKAGLLVLLTVLALLASACKPETGLPAAVPAVPKTDSSAPDRGAPTAPDAESSAPAGVVPAASNRSASENGSTNALGTFDSPLPPATSSDLEFVGVVSAINGSVWTIGGRAVTVDAQTEIQGAPQVNDTVKVEARLMSDGALVAREIDLANPNANGNLNSNDNANGNGNFNDNENENGNSNGNGNFDDNENENEDHNGNVNSNDNGNNNGNGNFDDNENENKDHSGNVNSNDNGD